MAWFWVRFKRPIKSKGLSGFDLGSCGFVPGVKSLILNYLVGSFDRFGRFFPADPARRYYSLSLGDSLRQVPPQGGTEVSPVNVFNDIVGYFDHLMCFQ